MTGKKISRKANTLMFIPVIRSAFGELPQDQKMVLLERFELSASPLPRECSTPELQQPKQIFDPLKEWLEDQNRPVTAIGANWTQEQKTGNNGSCSIISIKTAMPKTTSPGTREQKLAEKLRENLKRRKIQKRQRDIVRLEQAPNKPRPVHSEKTTKSETK